MLPRVEIYPRFITMAPGAVMALTAHGMPSLSSQFNCRRVVLPDDDWDDPPHYHHHYLPSMNFSIKPFFKTNADVEVLGSRCGCWTRPECTSTERTILSKGKQSHGYIVVYRIVCWKDILVAANMFHAGRNDQRWTKNGICCLLKVQVTFAGWGKQRKIRKK